MIAVVGKPNVTLKRIMVEDGFPHLSNYASRGRGATHELDGVFNCGYTPVQMRRYVFNRWRWMYSDLPIINSILVPNKLLAQEKMEDSGLAEHILMRTDAHPTSGNWIYKPYNSQGGVGIREYQGELRIPSGFYLQEKVEKFREFRAHVGLWLDNPVFTIQEKKPKPELWEEVLEGNPYQWPATRYHRERLPLIWNIESGFYFRRSTTPENREEKIRRYPLFKRIEELAIKATKALGYQFGAVDILMDDDRHLWVTEVNSHPAIKNEESKRIYSIALAPLKEMRKMDIFNLTQQTSDSTIRRTLVRRGGAVE
jgi:hypothetical protein